ncbi:MULTISPECIES: putative toxin-antitoxin system toxin component, PIN family [unclassified Mesorhizobium]|uniref:putative toxin-antitoxin system toxin component, PIN family n=1 Tax=unclassified Mesorhizobium TaxID=325217 RepID=UPI000BAEA428|nr:MULTISPECIES: putative toxin-antitoxin system toxin component, PIN family [unclassified Mesorhizobium]TGT58794.1 putative toxin-antitoxin system toxin component, PIN family [Mesorhizobium sp. M00.F.Ca.ET.170.01.1.1]AZO12267.1 putative toxin-antitoxin system toxin component, PIN family [Mesorhizobium sp. M3A.F.Ca.ET.080.04.2.1]PBB84747.1 putative toxin-antitoxin system toxin component, PIN family [Mesorhizobium sp. WSM3876]RWB74980.1 MAG: putative toxin-antitoxin system toxin component, PIN f
MKRIVLDTNVLTAGLRSRNGASFAILRLVAARQLRPLVTTALFLEYEAVLARPEQMAVHGMAAVELDRLLAGFAALAEPVEPHFLWRPQLADPKDEMVLEAAVNGRADALVTHNRRDFSVAVGRFNVLVATPAQLLEGFRT